MTKNTAKEIWFEKSGIPARHKESNFTNYKFTNKSNKVYGHIKNKTIDTILCGGVGTGKTHLACAKIEEVINRGYRAVYIEAIKLIREVKQSWKIPNVYESDIIKKYGHDITFLVIDEIGVQFNSDTERQYLTEIINDRYNNNLKTYLVTNLNLKSFTDVVGERIVDRFRESDGLCVFNWDSFRGGGK